MIGEKEEKINLIFSSFSIEYPIIFYIPSFYYPMGIVNLSLLKSL